MRKLFFIFISTISLLGCQSNLEVVSATKKIIYPGIQTQKPYIKFIVSLKASKRINIDSVLFVDNEKCYKLNKINYLKNTSPINNKHSIEVLFKGNEETVFTCNSSKNGTLRLFYTHSNISKKLEISSFTTKKETRR